jgi:hypothetical protein
LSYSRDILFLVFVCNVEPFRAGKALHLCSSAIVSI